MRQAITNHDARLIKTAVSRTFRSRLTFEIGLLLLIFIVILGIVLAVFMKEDRYNRALASRYTTSRQLQILSPLIIQESRSVDYLAFIASQPEVNQRLTELQATLSQLPPLTTLRQESEQTLLDDISFKHDQLILLVHRLIGREMSPPPTEQSLVNYGSELALLSQSDLVARLDTFARTFKISLNQWQTWIESDITRITNTEILFQRQAFTALLVLFVMMVAGIVVVGYTYIAPDYERTLRHILTQNQQLREVDSFKTEFLSLASHQLRTPLSELKWTLTLLLRQEAASYSSAQKSLIQQAKVSTDIMVKLVANLLNVSRIEQGHLRLHWEKSDIVPIVEAVAHSETALAREKRVTIHTQSDKKSLVLSVDPLLFKQVIQNLVDNAIAYNRKGGQVWIRINKTKPGCEITVSDTGYGISDEDAKYIFHKFYRGAEAMKKYPDGTGIGLYFVKGIVQKHGGSIAMKTSPKSGPSFTVCFPNKK